MANLATAAEVKTRLTDLPTLQAPTGMTDARIDTYATEATGLLLTATGYTAPPAAGLALDTLKGLCIRLVVNMLRADLFSMDADMAEMLRRERKDLLDEAALLKTNSASATPGFFELAGAG